MNRATGRLTTQSSTSVSSDAAFLSQYGNDRDQSQCSIAEATDDFNAWWSVDLGEVMNVTFVTLIASGSSGKWSEFVFAVMYASSMITGWR